MSKIALFVWMNVCIVTYSLMAADIKEHDFVNDVEDASDEPKTMTEESVFASADANKDGKISPAEVQTFVEQGFEAMDGKAEHDEASKVVTHFKTDGKSLFAGADKDGDQMLDSSEFDDFFKQTAS